MAYGRRDINETNDRAKRDYSKRATSWFGRISSTAATVFGGTVAQPTKSSANADAHATDGELQKNENFFAYGRLGTSVSLANAKIEYDRRAGEGALQTVPKQITFRMDARAARKPKAPPKEVRGDVKGREDGMGPSNLRENQIIIPS